MFRVPGVDLSIDGRPGSSGDDVHKPSKMDLEFPNPAPLREGSVT